MLSSGEGTGTNVESLHTASPTNHVLVVFLFKTAPSWEEILNDYCIHCMAS